MGLDMFLYGVRYLSKYEKDNQGNKIRDKTEIWKREEIYWRKANQIHKWFVDNCQWGEDNCQPHEVTDEQLEELYKLCKRVLKEKNLACELLPTQPGFFFGSTEYDEIYYNDIEYTKKELERLLEIRNEYDWFEYCSSW